MTTSYPAEEDDTTPLLPRPRERQSTPLPLGQITLLLLAQLTEPITSQSILPYINELISSLDIIGGDEKKVGYYAGLISSLYFAAEATTVLQWGRLSDRIGRKPVLLIGLSGMTLSTIFFGLSKTFWTLVISRALCGALNGNIGVMKSAMGELTDETNRARGFALMPVMWAAGSSIGPFIGGMLSRPRDRFPSAFKGGFWAEFPYFLPCLAASGFTIVAGICVAIFFRETLPPKKVTSVAELQHDRESATGQDVASLRALLTRPVLLAIANYGFLALLDIALACMGPVIYATPIEFGGLSLSPPSIGLFLGLFGVINGPVQLFCYPIIIRRLGPRTTLFTSMAAFVPIFAWFPLANALARSGASIVPALAVQMVFMATMDMAYATTFMYVTGSAPGRKSLGSVNGLAQTVISIVRTVGPAASTSLFALSLQHNLLGGYAIYVILIGLAFCSLAFVRMLPPEPWRWKEEDE